MNNLSLKLFEKDRGDILRDRSLMNCLEEVTHNDEIVDELEPFLDEILD